jgi:D-threo-aldose 1-dehydrogenase
VTVARLGFGTAALGRSLRHRERVRVLETALECGITHFDTAPLYGAGAAERALGIALRRAAADVTVATKAGIQPPRVPRLSSARGGRFAPVKVRASLEGSLRRLRVERVELLLLHEVTAADVDDALVEALEDAVRRGDVARIGIATGPRETAAILARGTRFPETVQLPLDFGPLELGERQLIVHSAIVGRGGSPGRLLRAAAGRYPTARVLFGSRNPRHVRETATEFLRAG